MSERIALLSCQSVNGIGPEDWDYIGASQYQGATWQSPHDTPARCFRRPTLQLEHLDYNHHQ